MEEKKNTGLIIVIVILLIAVLGLGGYLFYDKVINKTNEPNVEENKEIIENINLSSTQKIEYNKELTKKLERYLSKLLGFPSKINIKQNKNYLENTKEKIYLAWELSLIDDGIEKNKGYNVNGEEETGVISLNLKDFTNKYKKLFDEEISEVVILSNNSEIDNQKLVIKNNVIYGPISGWEREFGLKIKSYTVNNETNIHQLTLDFITKIDKNMNVDLDAIGNYLEPTIIDYPQDIVYSEIKIELQQKNNDYVFKSILLKKDIINLDKEELSKDFSKMKLSFAQVGYRGLDKADERLAFIALLFQDDANKVEVSEGWRVRYVSKTKFEQKYNDIFGRLYSFSKDFTSEENILGSNDDYPQIDEDCIVWPAVLGGALPSYITTMKVNDIVEKNGFYFITGIANYADESNKKFELIYELIDGKLYINDFKFIEQ